MVAYQTLAYWAPGPMEMTVILVVALLLFGRRLPEVMRNLGKGIVEFKRGVRGVENQIDDAASSPPSEPAKSAPADTGSSSADSEAKPADPNAS